MGGAGTFLGFVKTTPGTTDRKIGGARLMALLGLVEEHLLGGRTMSFHRHSNVVMALQVNPVRSACPPRALPAPSPGFSRHRHAHPCRHANVNFVANVCRAPAFLQIARPSSHRRTSSAARWRTAVEFCTRPSARFPGGQRADAPCSCCSARRRRSWCGAWSSYLLSQRSAKSILLTGRSDRCRRRTQCACEGRDIRHRYRCASPEG